MNRTQIFLLVVQCMMFVPVLAYVAWQIRKARQDARKREQEHSEWMRSLNLPNYENREQWENRDKTN